MKSLSLSNLGLGILFLGLAGYGVYNHNLEKEVKKAQSGDCGCNKSKKLVKEAPPPDSFVILDGGCRTCKPQSAVYNPLYINPIFDPNGYQTQDLTNFSQVEEPLNYSPYRTQVQKRSILRSNLGGGL